jgi:hypothetical protein
LVPKLLFQLCPLLWGPDWGADVLNLVDSPAILETPKKTMLPVLVVLFLVSYGLMTMLIVEQARTIDSQRFLIKQLFSDSAQLMALKNSAVQKQNQSKSHTAAPNPPSQSAPADRQKPGKNAISRSAGKLRQTAPLKPPKAAADTPDERRSMSTI